MIGESCRVLPYEVYDFWLCKPVFKGLNELLNPVAFVVNSSIFVLRLLL